MNPIRIFFIDDEADIRDGLRAAFEIDGVVLDVFESASQAEGALASKPPMLIVCDQNMPGMKGLEFCGVIRQKFPATPFLLLTGFADKDLALTAVKSGVTEVLEKPTTVEKLHSTLLNYVKQIQAAAEKDAQETAEIAQLFVEESRDMMSTFDDLVMRLESAPQDLTTIDSLFRKVHSIKGGAGAIPGAKLLAKFAHELEAVFSKIKKRELTVDAGHVDLFLVCGEHINQLITHLADRTEPDSALATRVATEQARLEQVVSGQISNPSAALAPQAGAPTSSPSSQTKSEAEPEDDGVWVKNGVLDSFMSLSGEFIVLKNYFQMVSRDRDLVASPERMEKKLAEIFFSFHKLTDELQEMIGQVRKVSLDRTFSRLPRLVRQTSQGLGKKIRFSMEGTELGVDRNISKSLSAALVHMVRNSIDHGIESTEKRVERGKPPEGSIVLSAAESQGVIQIVLKDDGGGIPRDRVIKKAIENKLVSPDTAEKLTDAEVFDLIFLPGFSTAETVSSVSGRGVGMDVVRTAVLGHHGKITTTSTVGQGTQFTLAIPVPKAVMVEKTVLSEWSGIRLAVPLVSISSITSCQDLRFETVQGVRTSEINGRTTPVRTYHELTQGRDIESKERLGQMSVIVLRDKTNQVGLAVDRIDGQFEAVIRPFDRIVGRMAGFKGTTVLGNDAIAYIVSSEDMFRLLDTTAPAPLKEAA